jgi:hypothetical protein
MVNREDSNKILSLIFFVLDLVNSNILSRLLTKFVNNLNNL